MYIRSVFIAFIIWLMCMPAAVAQKRTHATVNPNVDIVNGGGDLFIPEGDELISSSGDLNIPREQHTAITLNDGRVLIAGGRNNRYLKTAELFDPSTGLFEINYQTVKSPLTGEDITTVGKMEIARGGASGVLLLDGRVLIAGGYNGNYLSFAELFDPDTGEFDYTRLSMKEARFRPTITLMTDGKVLLTGGFNASFLASAEIYNPFSDSFALTSSMSTARYSHTATLMDDGKVLIVGGCANAESNRMICDEYLRSVEIYDPVTGVFETTGELNQARAGHTASLLPDGRVLIAGGTNGTSTLATAEIFDPTSEEFSYTDSLDVSRTGHTASVLFDGRILMAGGFSDSYLDTVEIFDPSSLTFSTPDSVMDVQRMYHAASVLSDGRVLLTGGLNTDLLAFDTNIRVASDNISPNIVYSDDSEVGFVSYSGSGVVVAFSPATGEVLEKIVTGGTPTYITPLADGNTLAVASAFDNRIFLIDMDTLTLNATYTFANASFGFGSVPVLSPDGDYGYISSTGTGEVIKFNTATGNELLRLGDLEAPAQITVTPDGETLLVVETSTAELYFVDALSMTVNSRLIPRDIYSTAGFTIYNKAVLSPDGETGIIASRDINNEGSNNDLVFHFTTEDGTLEGVGSVGPLPGFTTLAPDGESWVVLCSNSITTISIEEKSSSTARTSGGIPIGSSNIIFSPDGMYAFYSTSSTDRVLQHELETGAIVGSYLVGDIPDDSADQPSSIAMTPDGRTIAVLNAISNELDLLTDATMLRVPEFVNTPNQFTGITLINLSGETANLTLAPVNDSGGSTFQLSDGTLSKVDAISLPPLAPNAQFSMDLSQIIGFNNYDSSQGHLEITSDQEAVVGFAVTGSIRATYLESFLTNLQGISMYRFPERMYDWIVPDVPKEDEELMPAEFVFTNPNYNAQTFELIHFGREGALLEAENGVELGASSLEIVRKSGLFSDSQISLVLIAGGRDNISRAGATIYYPDGQDFGSTGSMEYPRHGHSAVLLNDGNILITGGRNGVQIQDTAEIYSPVFNRFFPAVGMMVRERYRHTSTLLNNGLVLIAGGQNSISINATAEIYDQETDIFTPAVGPMISPRDAHTATLLSDGRVLLAGGIDGLGLSATAEIYDPVTSTFTMTGNMNVGRAFHEAVLLPDGQVLIVGGYNGDYLSSAELYDPSSGTFAEVQSLNVERSNHTATLLQDGTVLVAGGENSSGPLKSAEIFYPWAGQFALLPASLSDFRTQHTATLLPDGTVILISGANNSGVLANSDVFYPESQVFSSISSSQTAQRGHTSTLLQEMVSGYLQGASEKGVMFREHRGAIAYRLGLDSINLAEYEGVTRLYSPRFVTLPSERTVLNIINANSDVEAIVTITLYDINGGIIGTPVTLELPSNNQVNDDLIDIFQGDPDIIGREGWVEVSSSVDNVVGEISFSKTGGNIHTAFKLSPMPLDEFIIPLAAENSDYRTRLSLLNVNGQSASVQIELWGAAGGTLPDASTVITLPPNNRIEAFLSDFFPGETDRLYGYIRVSSSQSLHTYSTLWDSNFKFACVMDPIPVPISVSEE